MSRDCRVQSSGSASKSGSLHGAWRKNIWSYTADLLGATALHPRTRLSVGVATQSSSSLGRVSGMANHTASRPPAKIRDARTTIKIGDAANANALIPTAIIWSPHGDIAVLNRSPDRGESWINDKVAMLAERKSRLGVDPRSGRGTPPCRYLPAACASVWRARVAAIVAPRFSSRGVSLRAHWRSKAP